MAETKAKVTSVTTRRKRNDFYDFVLSYSEISSGIIGKYKKSQWKVDLGGTFVPSLLFKDRTALQFALPYNLDHNRKWDANSTNAVTLSFNLKDYMEPLKRLASRSDEFIEVQIYSDESGSKDIIFQFRFHPSSLLQAIDGASSPEVQFQDMSGQLMNYAFDDVGQTLPQGSSPFSIVSRKPSFLNYLRKFRLPLCFSGLIMSSFASFSFRTTLFSFCPSFLPILIREGTKTVAQILPPLPELRSEAFQLGVIYEKTSALLSSGIVESEAVVTGLLSQGAQLLKRDGLSYAELKSVLATILSVELESQHSTTSRVLGMFSFVNMIWLIGILGITLSLGPVLFLMLSPLRDILREGFYLLYKKVILPVTKFCHEKGVFEFIAWMICFTFYLDGLRLLDTNETTAYFLSLTGIGLAIPAMAYTVIRQVTRSVHSAKFVEAVGSLYALSILVPCACFHNSSLLAFLCTGIFYRALGFTFRCFGLCYIVGFDGEKSMEVCATASAIILAVFSNIVINFGHIFGPFESSIPIFGSLVMFLALLIMSSHFYARDSEYVFKNFLMITALVVCFFFGTVFLKTSGLRNTTQVFFVMYMIEKWVEFNLRAQLNIWFSMFSVSIIFYFCGLYLNNNPELLVSMLSF